MATIVSSRSARWTLARRFDVVRALLDDANLDALVDPAVPIDSAPEAYARLDRRPGDAMQTVFVYA